MDMGGQAKRIVEETCPKRFRRELQTFARARRRARRGGGMKRRGGEPPPNKKAQARRMDRANGQPTPPGGARGPRPHGAGGGFKQRPPEV